MILRTARYFGIRFKCPCCGGHFRKFFSYGVHPRPNAQCPRCESLERHRLLWLYLQQHTNLFTADLKLLHIAPEPVFQNKFQTMSNLDYISADLESPLAQIKMDITEIPYPDNTFHAILCSHVLEHVEDDRKALRELFRVLKPGGWAILQSPIDLKRDKTFEDPEIVSPGTRERFFGQHDHVRLYGRDYKDRLTEAGFTVRIDDFVKTLDTQAVEKYRLEKDEYIYFCQKT